ILTGTPDGVVDCQPGDVVITSIEGIGALINTIEAWPVAPPTAPQRGQA
ncbi:MAG TPA: 2-hydroxyhepta-2,4-diene-1,7-dioate isomerase, partial [Burkholderiaceae bacterium]|nr:2-hydroxyhepta-2,4-diene-1,7-dioate isomerase [Burkholderiaceae bacterium]